ATSAWALHTKAVQLLRAIPCLNAKSIFRALTARPAWKSCSRPLGGRTQEAIAMYQFSRAIYRELASDIRPLPGESAQHAHTAVLEACERTIERMATDRHYFKRPVRTLFNDVR